MLRTFLRILLPILVLGGGFAVARKLVLSRKKSERKAVQALAPLVETWTVEAIESRLDVEAMGTVIPAQQIVLQSEVAGRIIDMSPLLVVGGRFAKGDSILQLDKRDFETTIKEQEGQVARSRLELALEQGRRVLAKREWALINKDGKGKPSSLVLREPHILSAKASLAASLGSLNRARRNLARTSLSAPFNAIVTQESVDLGQQVSMQSQIATLVGTDLFFVRATLPVSSLSAISLPDSNGKGGSKVRVLQDLGAGRVSERSGQVVRLLGDLDPVGRMARVLIAVENPLSTDEVDGVRQLPLFLGSFVRVNIEGRKIPSAVPVPRESFHGGFVWVLDNGKLRIQQVQVVWRTREAVLIDGGLTRGESIITSQLAAPVEGMALRALKESKVESPKQAGGDS